ncbi:MAG: DUF3108 domain-containing protein [Burkholderiales bacterium]|nr:DUF3108 domain-containing protein [Burkholderiales bacterium]
MVIAVLSGMLELPANRQRDLPLNATLVHVQPTDAQAISTTPPAQATPASRRGRQALTAPVLISEPVLVGVPQIIARSREPRPVSAPVTDEPVAATPANQDSQLPDLQPTRDDSALIEQRPNALSDNPPPRRIVLEYELKSSLADGRARYVWTTDSTKRRYAIEGSMEADGFFASMFAGKFEQESTGDILAGGLRPDRFSLRRGEAPAEVARFDWTSRQITHQRVRGEHVQPLGNNAQDLQSFIFQFSHEFKRPVLPERVSFAITNARKLDAYEFRVAGSERLRLALGELDTIHLVRIAQDPGDAYEAWLSPAHNFLPVKIRFMLSGRFPVDQLVTRIDIEP